MASPTAAAAADREAPAPYTLVAVDDDAPVLDTTTAKATPRLPQLTLTWEHVSVTVSEKNPETKSVQDKLILNDVDGVARPGELLAVMGASGAGKSTLLDCLANRNPRREGAVLVNGQPWNNALTKRSCYVLQDDLFYENLTVLEHMMFQAKLRMGPQSTVEERQTRVQEILRELGLSKASHTPIGGVNVKGISGGERKRLSLATELLTNPSILFVDEPTSGLDSFMAETIVTTMRDLARGGRTIIATIHQPSSDLFLLFDQLYLLAHGRAIYHGKGSDSLAYFAAQGLPCPSYMNPCDFFLKQLSVLEGQVEAQARVDRLTDAWADNTEHPFHAYSQALAADPALAQQRDVEVEQAVNVAARTSGVWFQTRVLWHRNVFRLIRDAVSFRARLGGTCFMVLLSGLIFRDLTLDQKGVQDFTGALFFLAVNQFMFMAMPDLIAVPLEIPLIQREHEGGLYNILVWYLAKNLSELPMQFVLPMIFLLPVYFLIGFPADTHVFFTFYIFIAFVASSAVGMAFMASCMFKRVELAPLIGILCILPFLLFSGLFLNSDSTPSYLLWLQQISPLKYCFHGLMRAYWDSVDTIPCTTLFCPMHSGADVLRTNSIKEGKTTSDLLLLLAINLGFRTLGGFFLYLRARKLVKRE